MDEAAVPYLYSIIRLVPDLDRGEAINIGLVMFCRPQQFLKLNWETDEHRLVAFAPNIPIDIVRSHLESHARIAVGDPIGGPVASLDIGERFHWLTNVSNTMIQPGPVHSGLTGDAAATFDRLFARLVQTDTEAS